MAKIVAITVLFCCSWLPAYAMPVCDSSDFVAVRTTETGVLLATTALDTTSIVVRLFKRQVQVPWRFRFVPFMPGFKVTDAQLATDGTHLRLVKSTGGDQIIDLTTSIVGIDEDTKPPPFAHSPFAPAAECQPQPNGDTFLNESTDRFLRAETVFVSAGEWRYFHVQANPELYAPVLEFNKNEYVRPSDFDIWSEMHASGFIDSSHMSEEPSKSMQWFLFRRYRQFRLQSNQSTVYYAIESLPGSWLIEYWLYYPFDIGGVGQHLHDSEHFFVEVDKLGGTVRRAMGAGHGRWAPSNIFQALTSSAIPVELPLFAMVERGKHATSPDIDRDGLFTPGVDTNFYSDPAKVWGIRDTIGMTDSNLRTYVGTMMLKRDPAHIAIPKDLFKYWRSLPEPWHVADDDEQYQLKCVLDNAPGCVRKLSEDSRRRAHSCDRPTPLCARGQVEDHSDFKNRAAMLKPGIFPRFSVRALFGRIPTADDELTKTTESSSRAFIGGSLEVAEIPIPKIFRRGAARFPFAGRIGADLIFQTNDWKNPDGITGRYEWMVANLFGLYAGLNFITDELTERKPDPNEQTPADEPSRKAWLSFGGLAEFPVNGRLLTQVQGGLTFNNVYGATWELRGGFGWAFGRQTRLGIPASASSPY